MPSSKPARLFWKKAFALGLLILGLAVWAELRLRAMPTIYHLKRDGLRAAAPEAQVLVLGASQANQGLDPSHWPVPAYNAACVGQDAYYDLELLRACLPRLPHLRALVLPVSLVSFDSSLLDTAETWRCFPYSQCYGIANESGAQRRDLRNWSALALSEPWPALKLALAGFVDPNAAVLNPQGFQAVPPMSEEMADFKINELTARKRWHYHQGILKPEEAARDTAYYQGMLALAAGRQLKVLFVVFPVDASYAQAVPAEAVQRRAARLRGLAQAGQARVLDYFTDKRFKTADFDDVDHLNANGAKKFSQILWEEALKGG